jgi:hypothetical protein
METLVIHLVVVLVDLLMQQDLLVVLVEQAEQVMQQVVQEVHLAEVALVLAEQQLLLVQALL